MIFFFKEYECSTNTDCFVVDSTRLHLTIRLPFVINSSVQDSGQILVFGTRGLSFHPTFPLTKVLLLISKNIRAGKHDNM